MKDRLKQLIVQAVTTNLLFEGIAGSTYNIQEVINELNLATVDKIYQRVEKKLEGFKTRSLSRKRRSSQEVSLELQREILIEVYEYKEVLVEANKAAKKAKEAAAGKLAVLRAAKTAKEIEAINAMSQEDLDKAIAEAESLV